jgi:putative transposase
MPSGGSALLLNVRPDDRQWRTATRGGEVGRGPEPAVHRRPVHALSEVLSQPAGRYAFQRIHQVRTRVTSEAKHAPHRAWLGAVSHVALGESFRDAARARRNWFASLSGKRKGHKVGAPRFKSKRGEQSIRLARNGFSLHGDCLYVAKVGDMEVRWSRDLPSVPSSVTVTRESDGRYYASFVVERDTQPLPTTAKDVGVDLGLTTLAVTSDGQEIPNPRRMKAREKALARAQRRLSRKQKGSSNRRKAVVKAECHGRTVVKVDRWFPSSQVCSVCGFKDGPKPLSVRAWTCASCGAVHDRDVNAARNILNEGRRTAAGLAVDVCGADVSPGHVLAIGDETEILVA